MANYLYNGVSLPDINTVWTDKETYPYAYIQNPSPGVYFLRLCAKKGTVRPNEQVGPLMRCIEIIPVTTYTLKGFWKYSYEYNEETEDVDRTSFTMESVVWSSYDILNEDGTLYFAASDPVPEDKEPKYPTSQVMGWLAGRATRARRGRGHVRKEYIQFDGAKYVDTGVICTQDTRIEAEFMRDTTVAQYLYGAVSDDNKASVTAYLSTGAGNWRFGGAYASITVSTGNKYSVAIDKSQALFDGSTKKYSGTVGTFEAPHTLLLGVNHTASGGIGANKFSGKVYSFKVYDGDNLVLDYVPAEKGGKDGFWDKVSNRFVPLEVEA